MSRYIDADDYEVQLKIDNHLNGYTDLARALHILRYQQTADVVEVVRCEDCRYWQNYHDVMVCGLTNAMMSISDYCSYGERADK